MSRINGTPIGLLKHHVEVTSRSGFAQTEQSPLGLLSHTEKGGDVMHHVEFMTVGLENKNAVLGALLNNAHVMISLEEEGRNFYPFTGDESVIPEFPVVATRVAYRLWDYKQALFRWEIDFLEMSNTLEDFGEVE